MLIVGRFSCALCRKLILQVRQTVPCMNGYMFGLSLNCWAAAQVVSSFSSTREGFSGSYLCKNVMKLYRKISFGITRWRNFRIFLNREGCNLSQTFPAPSENSDKSRYHPFCQQHLLVFCISDAWSLSKLTHKIWNPDICAYSGSTF